MKARDKAEAEKGRIEAARKKELSVSMNAANGNC